jgi:hypothetical protein
MACLPPHFHQAVIAAFSFAAALGWLPFPEESDCESAVRPHPALPSAAPCSSPDGIDAGRTLAERWLGAAPAAGGERRRIRIVQPDRGGHALRLEESVGRENRVLGGHAATHVLVAGRHLPLLEQAGIPFEAPGNSRFARVPVGRPADPDAVPEVLAQLHQLGASSASADGLIRACRYPGDPAAADGNAWHYENLGLGFPLKKGADIGALAAWDIRTDARTTKIAVLDSGITPETPDLESIQWSFPGETLGDGIDNDGNGYVDDVNGYDFVRRDPLPDDEIGHGTAVASLIGGKGGNGYGGTGVAWQASILTCKVINRSSWGDVSIAVEAIDYAIDADVDIIHIGFTLGGSSPLLVEALKRANDAGILIVCPSGNHPPGTAELPVPVPLPGAANLPLQITVAASTPADRISDYSVVDAARVHLAAPAAFPYGASSHDGTSYAAAIVTGALALAIAEFPDDSPAEIRRRLLESVDPIPGGSLVLSSGGRLNLARLLSAPLQAVPHDRIADRRILTDPAGRWTGTTAGAGTGPEDPAATLKPAPQRTLWFDWTAPSAGRLTLTPGKGTILRVFASNGGAPGALLAASLTAKPLSLPVQAGQNLLWTLDSAAPATVSVAWQLPPPNDLFVNAPTIASFPATVRGTTLGATADKAEKPKGGKNYGPVESVCWRFTAPRDMWLLIQEPTGNFTASLYEAKPKTIVVPKKNQGISYTNGAFRLTAGQAYGVIVRPRAPGTGGAFSLGLAEPSDPAIIEEPADRQAAPGESVHLGFPITFDNRWPAADIKFYKDGVLIPHTYSSVLSFYQVAARDYGSYHATITSGGVTRTTRTYTLSPRAEPPRLLYKPEQVAVVAGQPARLKTRFRSHEPLTYSWKKDGQTIGALNSALISIADLEPSDAGLYTVTATNIHGSTTAEIPVTVQPAPWKHWIERTPGTLARGPVLQVSRVGSLWCALTPTAWLTSSDDGTTWSARPLPEGVFASTGAMLPDGTLVVSSNRYSSADDDAYTWRSPAPGIWHPLPMAPAALHELGGSLYAIGLSTNSGGSSVQRSTDGLSWTPVTASDGRTFSTLESHRFSNAIGLQVRFGTSGSQGMVIRSDGSMEQLSSYSSGFVWLVDGVASQDPGFHSGEFLELETGTDGLKRGLLDAGSFVYGTSTGLLSYTSLLSTKSLGFSSYARNGDRWLLGYPDGTLWTGTRLEEAPRVTPQASTGLLQAFRDEFLAGDYHSPDGSRWQPLGPVTGEITAQNGSTFQLRFEDPVERGFDLPDGMVSISSETLHPIANAAEPWVGSPPAPGTTDGLLWTSPASIPGYRGVSANGLHLAVKSFGRAWISNDGVAWRPITMRGLPAAPEVVATFQNHFLARVQERLYASTDGIGWFAATSGIPVTSLVANRHSLLFRSSDGRIFQPDAPAPSGPVLRIPASQTALAVPRHQAVTYTVEASDPDGDLVAVECHVDGVLKATRTAPPYTVTVDTPTPGTRALEFVARDGGGRIARATGTLRVLPFGELHATPLFATHPPESFRFNGRIYSEDGLLVSDDGDRWMSTGLEQFPRGKLHRNDRALVVTTTDGVLASKDGVTWTFIGHFKPPNTNSAASVIEVHDGVFQLTLFYKTWTSTDGFEWTPHSGNFQSSVKDAVWADDLHGLAFGYSSWVATSDGGNTWVRLDTTLSTYSAVAVPIDTGFLVRSNAEANGTLGVYYLPKGSHTFSALFIPQSARKDVMLIGVEGSAYYGVPEHTLFSTRDAVNIATHVAPSNKLSVTELLRHGGEWLALSQDRFCASPDLVNWRVLFDIADAVKPWSIDSSYRLRVRPHADGGLLITNIRAPYLTDSFFIRADLSVAPAPLRTNRSSNDTELTTIPAADKGVDFRGRLVISTGWLHTRTAGLDGQWAKVGLMPAPDFVAPFQHDWPCYGLDRYHRSGELAATADRLLLLLRGDFVSVSPEYFVTSEDGVNFVIHNWSGPVRTKELIHLMAAPDRFVATLTGGRTMTSDDGFNWTVHSVSAGMEFGRLLRFQDQWYATASRAGYYAGSTWVRPRTEIWRSADGASWDKVWENPQDENQAPTFANVFVAHGVLWVGDVMSRWMKSTDGTTWTGFSGNVGAREFHAFAGIAEHPDGIFATNTRKWGYLYIIDPVTWRPLRSFDLNGVTLHWLNGWPYIKTPHGFNRWTESDPRLASITATVSGSAMSVDLSANELPEAAMIRLSVNPNPWLGNPSDPVLNDVRWSDGVPVAGTVRRFTVPFTPEPGTTGYRVVATLSSASLEGDTGLQNNTVATSSAVFTGAPAAARILAGTGWSGDPDQDGLSSWHEEILGTDPNLPSGPGYQVRRESDGLRFSFERPVDPLLHPVPEFSTTLSIWSTRFPEGTRERIRTLESGREAVDITIPVTAGAGFIRLRLPDLPAGP